MTPLPHDTGPQRHLQPLSRLAAATALLLGTVTAQAHHGWSWAEGEQMTLQGQIARISMAPPHPVLTVQAADGGRWQVDLGNPSQTERSATATTAQVGDAITVRGNRSKDAQALHMKAVHIVGGKNYDMYPERIQD
jgi:hypothetical protein